MVTVACLLSVAAYLHFYPNGETIAYGDAKSHLLIARRVFFADTPGAGQLGGVWLPLPHLLMLPLIWNSWAYYSGFAGSVVMMACYVVCTLFAYKFTWRLTGRHTAAAAAAAVFALNPNILYMQSTPMTELLMFATMMGAVYGLLCWIQTDEEPPGAPPVPARRRPFRAVVRADQVRGLDDGGGAHRRRAVLLADAAAHAHAG